MPNSFAFVMLLSWPLIMAVLFRTMSLERAFVWSLLGGYLILPPRVGIDLPLIPTLDKIGIPNISAILIILAYQKEIILRIIKSKLNMMIVILIIIQNIVTSITNFDSYFVGDQYFRGSTIYDAFSFSLRSIVSIIPFLLASEMLWNRNGQEILLKALFIGALIYSIPIILEIRLSPQLNVWIYGFFPHDFLQQVRFGGFRAVVFLGHGLLVAMFIAVSLLAALALLRNAPSKARVYFSITVFYMFVILILSKSVGPIVYVFIFSPAVLIFRVRLQVKIAAVVAVVVISYPVLRDMELIPVDRMLAVAESFNAERARSLRVRLDNEKRLLERADERPFFGWGGSGRNEIYDPQTGRKETITDGAWIIIIGNAGWAGFLIIFGMLTFPLIILWWRLRQVERGIISPYIGGISLILAVNVFDLIPNASINSITWLLAGCVMGYARNVGHVQLDRPLEAARPPKERTPYNRSENVKGRFSRF